MDDFDGRRRRRRNSDSLADGDLLDGKDVETDKFGNAISTTLFEASPESDIVLEPKEADSKDRGKTVVRRSTLTRKRSTSETSKDLNAIPYLIPIETGFSHLDFIRMLKNFNEKHDCLRTIVDRILKTNSIHLLEENRRKMIEFYDVMLEHLFYVVTIKHLIPISQTTGFNLGCKADDPAVLFVSLYKLSSDINRNLADIYLPKLQRLKKKQEQQLELCKRANNHGGDLGCEQMSEGFPHELFASRKHGGHKVRSDCLFGN